MTNDFDTFCESIINEYTTSKRERSAPRYADKTLMPNSSNRRIRATGSNVSDSQKTKIYKQQQYVGNFFKKKGIRVRNKSEKTSNEIGIARGLGGRIKIDGVNPKQPRASVNSKQGNMEVKFTRPDGVSKIGSRGLTDYDFLERIFSDED